MLVPKYIIVHHSAVQDGPGLSWPNMRKYHMVTRRWKDIGYHAGIEMQHDNYEVLLGRPAIVPGAHCPGHNNDSLGFCFVGNYDLHAPPNRLLEEAVYRILLPWVLAYDIPVENIQPHSKFRQTHCPGQKFDVDKIQQLLKDGIAALN